MADSKGVLMTCYDLLQQSTSTDKNQSVISSLDTTCHELSKALSIVVWKFPTDFWSGPSGLAVPCDFG